MLTVAHAYSLLDSYVYGFALIKMNLPFETHGGRRRRWRRTCSSRSRSTSTRTSSQFLTEHAMRPGYDYADEFEYGLDLVLDGLERAHPRA